MWNAPRTVSTEPRNHVPPRSVASRLCSPHQAIPRNSAKTKNAPTKFMSCAVAAFLANRHSRARPPTSRAHAKRTSTRCCSRVHGPSGVPGGSGVCIVAA
ncbi:hypothetical protein ACFQZ4_51955 [Catellatospora coxensis]